ncbi:Formation of crista junctions protein 1 [Modicella reniformis]|uniref:MICOS complex subunit MIC60 n=1 Tax=Modicella reniformis TaxID=1440133 RepID=A0A9P6M7Q2_9FUNG|nr:Formation of crista junctions protein 1 [Modicella reniformis]
MRATQYRALTQRFNSTDAKNTMAEAAATPAPAPAAKSGFRFRTKALITLTVIGAEVLKDSKDFIKVVEGASQASGKAVDLSGKAVDLGKTAYRKASDLINGTTTTATAKVDSLIKKVQELEQPKPAAPATRSEYVPSDIPPPSFLPGATPGKPAKEAETKATKKPAEVKGKVMEKAASGPPKKLIKVAPIESEEPIMANLNATLQQLVAILNETGIPEQGHQVFEKANGELKHLNERIEALKVEGEAQADTVMAELTEKHNKLANEAKRRWVREVKVRVENERGGRLARLDHINLRLRTLERQEIDNAEFLEQSARTHQLWCGIKALEKVYETGERRPFDRELARLKRLAEAERDADVLKAVLAAVPESVAIKGVDSVPELIDRFEYVADKVRQASLVPENGGILSHAMSAALNQVEPS